MFHIKVKIFLRKFVLRSNYIIVNIIQTELVDWLIKKGKKSKLFKR